MELVRTAQAAFISQDREMYYEPLDSSVVAKTWDISDESVLSAVNVQPSRL